MIELYTHPMSPCAQKVRMVLAIKGLDWTKHHVDLPNKENLNPAYFKLNPLGVVPTLVHDSRPIIESSIICEYLDDTFPDPALSPVDTFLRSKMRFWMKHVDVKLHPACGTLHWPMVMREKLMEKSEAERNALLDQIPEKPRRERQKRLVQFGLDAPDVKDAVNVYRKTVLDMELALQDQPWLVGPEITLADICVAPYFQKLHQFSWTQLFDVDCPRVREWFDAIQNTEEYKVAVAADFPPQALAELQEKGKKVRQKISIHLAPG